LPDILPAQSIQWQIMEGQLVHLWSYILAILTEVKGEFAIPPGKSWSYCLMSSVCQSHSGPSRDPWGRSTVFFWPVSVSNYGWLLKHKMGFHSVYGGARTYDNAYFIQAFNQSFINVILSLDPNKRFDPTDRMPPWRNWSSDHTEMLFNETATGDPDIRAV
jgi:hypothetical protein